MTMDLYGYDTPPELLEREYRLAPPPKAQVEKPIHHEPKKPEPPKVKEFNKQLVIKEIQNTNYVLEQLNQKAILVKDIMSQEDADDVYDIGSVISGLSSVIQEWTKTRECLIKELELSSVTLKQMGSSIT